MEQSAINNSIARNLGVALLLLYVMSLFFPEPFWGLHHYTFLPLSYQLILFIISIYFLIVYPITKEKPVHETIFRLFNQIDNWWVRACIAGIFAIVFYYYPIYYDTYGDAIFLFPNGDLKLESLDNFDLSPIGSFNFLNPKLGTQTTYAIIGWGAHYFDITVQTFFRIWDAAWGGIFIFSWLQLSAYLIINKSWRVVLTILGLNSPLLQNYFGHFEIYAPVLVGMLWYFHALILTFERAKIKSLLLLFLIFIGCLKLHITAYLLSPSLLLAIIWVLSKNKKGTATIFTFKGILNYVCFPIVFMGALLYYVMGSANGKRTYTLEHLEEVVFLPIKSSEAAPLDRYNLFSPVHFFDYLNMIPLWSSAAFFLLIILFIHYRKQINWNSSSLIVIGSTLLIYLGFFFVFNPLLSMPNDWDIFSLCAIPLFVFLMLFIQQIQHTDASKQVTGSVIALSLFTIPVFMVNTNPSFLSEKLETQGIWEFKSYWMGASTSILEGIKLEKNIEQRQQRLIGVLDKLEPFAVKGNDIEYAELLHNTGLYFSAKKDFHTASFYFKKANEYSIELCKNHYQLLNSLVMIEDFELAMQEREMLLKCPYPSITDAYRSAIHVSLLAKQKTEAEELCKIALQKFPNNEFIAKVYFSLKNGNDALQLFASKPQINTHQPNTIVPVTKEKTDSEKFAKPHNNVDSIIHLIERNRKDAVLGNDVDYATLLKKAGYHFSQVEKNYNMGLSYFNESEKYLPNDCETAYHQLICNFMLNSFEKANSYSDKIISCKFPSEQKAYKMAIHTSVNAGNLKKALIYSDEYLFRWPNDPFIKNVNSSILAGKKPAYIQSLFMQK